MKTSKEYNYLLQDIAEFKKRDAEISIPLNEQALIKQRDDANAKTEARENERRISRGLPAIVKNKATPKSINEPDIAEPKEKYDFVQDESLQIITDFIANPQIAKTATKF